jgi:phosphatidylinositol kinase/protein kinase (PI-3  family)
MVNLHWVKIRNGYIAIGHKPGRRISFSSLKKGGTSVVLTLLKENEGATQIGEQLNLIDIEWIWFPFSASNPHSGKKKTEDVLNLFQKLNHLLETGNKIFIHCSAGIHRTGMITYGLLRYLGKEKEEALNMLRELRIVTASQAGEKRLNWGDQFFDMKLET